MRAVCGGRGIAELLASHLADGLPGTLPIPARRVPPIRAFNPQVDPLAPPL
jgi:hypothetical protein